MDDFFVDDILENLNYKEKKKKINSKDKGHRGERDLADVLKERFPNHKGFFRVVGSGNRWSSANLTDQAKQVLTADLVCPEGFKFSIECKYGYADIDLSTCFDKGVKSIDEFLNQATKDAAKVNKLPMMCWRKQHKNWLVFIKQMDDLCGFSYKLNYREWIGVSLKELLTQPDSFFFN